MGSMIPRAGIEAEELLPGGTIEPERVEFAADWDPGTTGPRVLRALCAFANDFSEANGGYVVIGAARGEERPLPPGRGLTRAEITAARKWICRRCLAFDPPYFPIPCERTVDGRRVLVIRALPSAIRPHRTPKMRGQPARCWVRRGVATVDSEQHGYLRRYRNDLAARVPWDDRPARENRIEDLSAVRVREHLRAVGSRALHDSDDLQVCRGMRLTAPGDPDDIPRNVGLLLFGDDPSERSPGARIEVVRYSGDEDGPVLEERTFRGGLVDQILACQSYLERPLATDPGGDGKEIATPRWCGYPGAALREVLVNAVLHRAYGPEEAEPIRVRVHPDRLTVTSTPGPVPALEPRHFLPNSPCVPVPARNPRVAEFLRERRLAEGHYAGLDLVFRAMNENGSPPPEFTFDEERTYFRATLPAHPDAAYFSATPGAADGRSREAHREAESRLDAAFDAKPASGPLAGALLRLRALRDDRKGVEEARRRFRDARPDADEVSKATALLRQTLKSLASDTAADHGGTGSDAADRN